MKKYKNYIVLFLIVVFFIAIVIGARYFYLAGNGLLPEQIEYRKNLKKKTQRTIELNEHEFRKQNQKLEDNYNNQE